MSGTQIIHRLLIAEEQEKWEIGKWEIQFQKKYFFVIPFD